MIRKYVFGTPVCKTMAVIEEVERGDVLPYFLVEDEDKLSFRYSLHPEDIVWGLGENMGSMNKRPGHYVSYNVDNPHHRKNTPSLYSAHNFFIVDGKEHFGAFFDTPSKISFDIDRKHPGEIVVRTSNKNLEVYIIEASDSYSIAREFLKIIGPSFLPPLWAFGYGQSRWGYKTELDFLEVIENHKLHHLPLDYVCMDIDYMDRYMDFTVDKVRFPFLKKFVEEAKKRHIRLVPIIDAAIKVKEGYDVYEEGIANDYFCHNKDGSVYKAAVWPGMCHFPDFLREDVRKWFGDKYKFLTDMGFEGFWNDMNEPSIFYSEYSRFRMTLDLIRNFIDPHHQENKAEETAHREYHNFTNIVEGKKQVHHLVHNLYGASMTQASGEGISAHMSKRYLLFSRSSYIGAHRYGGLWTGDNESIWDHLRLEVRQLPGLNMCGFLYSGADTGGFADHCDRELMLRWLAVSLFTPLMRNHSAKRSRRQECYRYKGIEDFRTILRLRYILLPYLYSEFMKAALSCDMYIKPLAFAYNDETSRRCDDQLLVGDSLMIAPIMEKGKTQRKAWLPEEMTEVRFNKEGFHLEKIPAGEHTLSAGLGEVVFYIRKGKCIPIAKEAENTDELDLEDIQLIGDGDTYEQYLDDGSSKDCSLDNIRILRKEE